MMKKLKTYFLISMGVLLLVPSSLSAEGAGAREELLSALELGKNTENLLVISRRMQDALGTPEPYFRVLTTIDGKERFHQRQAVHEGILRLWKEDQEFCKQILSMFEALEEGAAQAEIGKVERGGELPEGDLRTLEKWVYVPTGRKLLELRAKGLIGKRQYQEARRIYDLLLKTEELFPKPVSEKAIINGLLRCEASLGDRARVAELLKRKGEAFTAEEALFDLQVEDRAKRSQYFPPSVKEFGFESFREALFLYLENSKSLQSRMEWHVGERVLSSFWMTCKLLDLAEGDQLSKNLELKEKDLSPIVAFLSMASKDTNQALRIPAIRALGSIGPAAKEAVPALIAALKDSGSNMCLSAAIALGQIGPAAKEAVPALIAVLKDPHPNVRKYAAWALGRIGPDAKEAVPALERIAQDPASVDSVRDRARGALQLIKEGAGK